MARSRHRQNLVVARRQIGQGDAASGGFSPRRIDKLLKIIR
jgi:hypothetical protein